jgi:hypothetical protein
MTVLGAFHLAVDDDGELVRRAAAGDERHNLSARDVERTISHGGVRSRRGRR